MNSKHGYKTLGTSVIYSPISPHCMFLTAKDKSCRHLQNQDFDGLVKTLWVYLSGVGQGIGG